MIIILTKSIQERRHHCEKRWEKTENTKDSSESINYWWITRVPLKSNNILLSWLQVKQFKLKWGRAWGRVEANWTGFGKGEEEPRVVQEFIALHCYSFQLSLISTSRQSSQPTGFSSLLDTFHAQEKTASDGNVTQVMYSVHFPWHAKNYYFHAEDFASHPAVFHTVSADAVAFYEIHTHTQILSKNEKISISSWTSNRAPPVEFFYPIVSVWPWLCLELYL